MRTARIWSGEGPDTQAQTSSRLRTRTTACLVLITLHTNIRLQRREVVCNRPVEPAVLAGGCAGPVLPHRVLGSGGAAGALFH